VLALAFTLTMVGTAHADDVEQAKALFSAGAAAYEKHDYAGAIRAFEGAQRAAPRPPIIFSLAQAHRRQFYVDGNVDHQHQAVELFREYVKQVPNGGRHEDAMRALQELGALSVQRDATSISINSSGTPGARVSLDSAPPIAAPLIGPVSVGKHHAVISADGFVTEERDVTAVEGQIVALDVPLKEKQARITITAPSGARVTVDGRPMGETPLSSPLELVPGQHVVAVSKNGHEGYLREITLARGDERRVDAPLGITKQRRVATGLLVASGVTVVAAAAFAATAAAFLGQANAILNKQSTQNITPADVDTYNYDRDMRGAWLIAAGASFAGAGILAATGLVLFAFDNPTAGGSATPDERKTQPTPRKTEPSDLAITPMISPTTLGATVVFRF
jgi:hypothetical protein